LAIPVVAWGFGFSSGQKRRRRTARNGCATGADAERLGDSDCGVGFWFFSRIKKTKAHSQEWLCYRGWCGAPRRFRLWRGVLVFQSDKKDEGAQPGMAVLAGLMGSASAIQAVAWGFGFSVG